MEEREKCKEKWIASKMKNQRGCIKYISQHILLLLSPLLSLEHTRMVDSEFICACICLDDLVVAEGLKRNIP